MSSAVRWSEPANVLENVPRQAERGELLLRPRRRKNWARPAREASCTTCIPTVRQSLLHILSIWAV